MSEAMPTEKQLDVLLNRIQGCRNEMRRVTEEIKSRVEWTLSASPNVKTAESDKPEPFGFKDCVNDCLSDMDEYNAIINELASGL